jgi:hypothetical protein
MLPTEISFSGNYLKFDIERLSAIHYLLKKLSNKRTIFWRA